MLGIIVGTHGHLAEELVKTCSMICGKPENLATVTLVPGEGPEDLAAKYQQAIKDLDTSNGVIILNDLFGGSPYNAACRVAMNDENCGIVTGVSLPMLIEVVNYRLCNGENANVQAAMDKAVEASATGAQKFHKSQVEDSDDEEGDDL